MISNKYTVTSKYTFLPCSLNFSTYTFTLPHTLMIYLQVLHSVTAARAVFIMRHGPVLAATIPSASITN